MFRGVLISVTNVEQVPCSVFCVWLLIARAGARNAANVEKFNYLAECRILFQLCSKLMARAGIVDIGIEYCGTVCSQHHTVWEDPLSLRGAKLLYQRAAPRYVQ